jgi:hypothetical protein
MIVLSIRTEKNEDHGLYYIMNDLLAAVLLSTAGLFGSKSLDLPVDLR